jgi:hypothetical protein
MRQYTNRNVSMHEGHERLMINYENKNNSKLDTRYNKDTCKKKKKKKDDSFTEEKKKRWDETCMETTFTGIMFCSTT